MWSLPYLPITREHNLSTLAYIRTCRNVLQAHVEMCGKQNVWQAHLEMYDKHVLKQVTSSTVLRKAVDEAIHAAATLELIEAWVVACADVCTWNLMQALIPGGGGGTCISGWISSS